MTQWNRKPNRSLCDVLADMRRCWKTRNFALMKSLIEEAQIIGYRMEAALEDYGDIRQLREEKSALVKAIESLESKVQDKGLTKEQIEKLLEQVMGNE